MEYPFSYPAPRVAAAPTREAARTAMRRACGALYGLGALTMAASLLTPQPNRGSLIALGALGAVSAIWSALLLLRADVPDLLLLLTPGFGAVLVSAPMVVEQTVTGSPFFYLWPGLIAACFLRGREVLATMAWSAVCFLAVLLFWVDSPDGDAILFVDVTAAIGVTTALVYVLKRRVLVLVERLHHASSTDPLTGVLNRRAFEEASERLAERAAKGGPSWVLALMDLDHFKQVNDRLGHAAGDRALVRFAQIVLAEKRSDDIFGRLGGEEFALVLADTDLDGAHAFADRLRRTIQADTAADEASLTVSVGLAPHLPGDSLDSLLHSADVGLYAAKDAGRNRVVVFDGLPEDGAANRASPAGRRAP